MLDPLLKTCFPHLLKMVWILIAYRVIYVKNEDLTPLFSESGQSFDEYMQLGANRPDNIRNIIYLQPLGQFKKD